MAFGHQEGHAIRALMTFATALKKCTIENPHKRRAEASICMQACMRLISAQSSEADSTDESPVAAISFSSDPATPVYTPLDVRQKLLLFVE